ncbi:MAG: hypothetical protein LBG72_04910 [Spirochaetaceae bacterium]|jgi:hypothetical protein|nr:hypothetical protein [Spirochaetaceae bacterium]
MKLDTKTRRAVFRAAFAVCWLAALAVLFVTGRGHTLLIDNAPLDGAIAAFQNVKVSVNGALPVTFGAGDRDRFFVRGTKARIKIEAGKGESSPALPFEAVLRLPLRPDALLLSLPRLAAGTGDALEEFTTAPAAPSTDESAANEVIDTP